MPMDNPNEWWRAERGECHGQIFRAVEHIEEEQSQVYERFARLECLYDPDSAWTRRRYFSPGGARTGGGTIQENVIASNVDTVSATIASTEVRARVMTDGATWATKRRAVQLEAYAEQLSRIHDAHSHAVDAFRDAAIKGTGLLKVYADQWSNLTIERVPVDDIIVDEREARNGQVRQLHQRVFCSAEVLIAAYPQYEEEIRASSARWRDRGWAGYRPIETDEVVVMESWRLPQGKTPDGWSLPGRHVISVYGADLVDETWDEPRYPFAVFRWTRPPSGWYGIGLAQRIAGHQRQLNKHNWQIDALLDQCARPTTYVQMADANLAVRTTNRIGSIVPYKVAIPKTVIPPAVSPEVYNRREAIRASAYEESGVSRMAAQAYKPAGLDSGRALMEYRDQTTQRFAQQEKGFESFVLDAVWLMLDVCKQLGKSAPVMMRPERYGAKPIRWRDVDMGELKIQLYAASQMSRTPAGRTQMVMEMAQAGIIGMDVAQRMLQHPDIESEMSLYTAALDDIDRTIEMVLDGEMVVPEPLQNLQMGLIRFQQAYLRARAERAPEEILEGLRQWITQATFILTPPAPPPPVPMPDAQQLPPEAQPMMPPEAPPAQPGQEALI